MKMMHLSAARVAGLALLLLTPMEMALAQLPAGVVMMTPDEIKALPPLDATVAPGSPSNTALVGSRTKPGLWVERVSFPANFTHYPHSHPDDRTYTVISGTLYLGFGDKVDETKIKAMPPGSFWTEPANVNHFLVTRNEPITFQVTGNGPSGTKFVDPALDPRNKK
jgi:quercetin dioxygenase-like cupin family protein